MSTAEIFIYHSVFNFYLQWLQKLLCFNFLTVFILPRYY